MCSQKGVEPHKHFWPDPDGKACQCRRHRSSCYKKATELTTVHEGVMAFSNTFLASCFAFCWVSFLSFESLWEFPSSNSSPLQVVSQAPKNSFDIPSPVCHPRLPKQPIRRIVLAHMRKAGGSTLRAYLKKVSKSFDLEFVAKEGFAFESPTTRNDTLYVTHLRDPIQRTLSHYRYEGRWPCAVLKNKTATKKNSVDLSEWLESDHFYESLCRHRARPLWKCSWNCFTRWLAMPYTYCEDVSPEWLVQRALETARQYHLIIDIDRLETNSEYVTKLEEFFGLPGLSTLRSSPACDQLSKAANQRTPIDILKDTETIKLLQSRHVWDVKIHKVLTSCRDTTILPNCNFSNSG
jgi:hypothetical protein